MRKLKRGLLALALGAAATATLVWPGVAAAESAVAGEVATDSMEVESVGVYEAVPLSAYEAGVQQDVEPMTCQHGWDVAVGGFYPDAWLQYAATFECSQIGPNVSGTIRGSLHEAPGGLLLHTGPDEGFAWCCNLVYPPASSGGEIGISGPGSFYINADAIEDLLPDPDGTIWVWSSLPEGCSGVGSPRAICDIDSDSFDVT